MKVTSKFGVKYQSHILSFFKWIGLSSSNMGTLVCKGASEIAVKFTVFIVQS